MLCHLSIKRLPTYLTEFYDYYLKIACIESPRRLFNDATTPTNSNLFYKNLMLDIKETNLNLSIAAAALT